MTSPNAQRTAVLIALFAALGAVITLLITFSFTEDQIAQYRFLSFIQGHKLLLLFIAALLMGVTTYVLAYRTLQPSESNAKATSDQKVSLAKLPSTSPDLFGRHKELAFLDEAWTDVHTNVVVLVAWAGMGKTTLVNAWLKKMKQDHYRRAQRVYGWSFYSQGITGEQQASSDEFIACALAWFGDSDQSRGSARERGQRLAELIKEQRTLLILDGLEPLQYPPGESGGRLKDPGLYCLLRELAWENPGLCIVTSRLQVDDLKDWLGTSVRQLDLDYLTPNAGAKYLAHSGVRGTIDELMQASHEFGGHALALTLLGKYLAIAYQGDVRQRDKIVKMTREPQHGGHARRVMKAYEGWFSGKPEENILYIMGLFDGPVESGAIAALKARPAINGLTSQLQQLSDEEWRFVLNNVRQSRLLVPEDPSRPDILDCHPLVRQHFGEKLKANNRPAWKAAHSRLYEYYKSQAREYPDTIEEMGPLYAAISHGCEADRHEEAVVEVYWQRISRGEQSFSMKKLGAIASDLAALSFFFDQPWVQPAAGLSDHWKSIVLNNAGVFLTAIGRLAEAATPLLVGLRHRIDEKNWKSAAIQAGNLSKLYVTMGNLNEALKFAKQGVEFADRSGDFFQRINKRALQADVYHQLDRLAEAEDLFRNAEKIQQVPSIKQRIEFGIPPTVILDVGPLHPHHYLYSLQGFLYCDLLLDQGKYQEVLERADLAIQIAEKNRWFLDIALDNLSLGQAYLLQASHQEGLRNLKDAESYLEKAITGLRGAGHQDYLVRGLIAQASLYRERGGFSRALRDLDEAMNIAAFSGMNLYQVDGHLEYVRLYLAMNEREKTAKSLSIAKDMIQRIGYNRRWRSLADLEQLMDSDRK